MQRRGRQLSISVFALVGLVIGALPTVAFAGDVLAFGAELIEVTPELRKHLGVSDRAGLLVGRVELGGEAERGGLEVGDVVTEIDGWSVDSVGDVHRRLRHYVESESVAVTYFRGGTERQTRITVDGSTAQRRGEWDRDRHSTGEWRHVHSHDDWHAEIDFDADELEADLERLGERLGRLGERLGRVVERSVDDIDWEAFGRDMDRLGREIDRSIGRSLGDLDRVTIEIDGEVLEADLDRLGRDIERMVERLVDEVVDEVEYHRD